MTNEQADSILLTLKAAHPHADNGVDPIQAKARDAVYRRALLAWNYEAALDGVMACIQSCRFYPTVAELHDAYAIANRPKPERVAASNMLPKPGETTASPEEIRAACAAAIATVEANSVVSDKPKGRTFTHPTASPDEEKAAIEATIAKTGRAEPARSES